MAKFFKYQQVDSVTGVSVGLQPAVNGLTHPNLPELKVITFSKDGQWVYAEAGETATADEDNNIFEISKGTFAFEIKTKIDQITEERIANLEEHVSAFVERESERIAPEDPYRPYSVSLIEKTVTTLKNKIIEQLQNFVFDDTDPIESYNLWDNRMEVLSFAGSELRVPYYNLSFSSRWEWFSYIEKERIKETGTDEEKIGLRLMEVPT